MTRGSRSRAGAVLRRRALAGGALLCAFLTVGGCVAGSASLPSATRSDAPAAPTSPESPPSSSLPPASSATPAAAAVPAPRGYHALVDVPDRLGVLLISGSARPPADFLAETWAFEPSTGWTDLHPDPVIGVTDHAAFDASARRVFAGVGETWLYEPGESAWERLAISGPEFAAGSRSAWDAESQRVILVSSDGATWALDVEAAAWTRMAPAVSPPARGWGGVAYDASVDRVVLFGGVGAGNEHLADTWTFDYDTDTWAEVNVAAAPPGRTYSAMTYDPVRRRALLFGGASGEWEAETVLDDLWSFDAATGTWTRLSPAKAPSARAWHAMAFDTETGLVVLFGGGPDRRHYTAETWLYDPVAGTWSEWLPD